METNDHFLSHSDMLLSTTNTCEFSIHPICQISFDVATHQKKSLEIQGHSHRKKRFSKYSGAAFPTPDSAVGAQGWKESVWGALLYPRAKHPTQTGVCSTGNTHRAPAATG